MEFVSIRELRRQTTATPVPFEIHAQLETLLSKTSRGGKPFYELKLADADDNLTVRCWDETAMFQAG